MKRGSTPTQLSDAEVLGRFGRHVATLRERPYLRTILQEFTFRITTDPKTKEVSCTIQKGDQEQLRSFLLAFRKMHASDEPANLPRVLNIALRLVKDGDRDLAAQLAQIRAAWHHQWQVGFIQMKQQGVTLTPSVCFDLRLNGEIFHSDEQKRLLLDHLRRATVPSVTIQFLWSLQYLVALALYVERVISAGLADGRLSTQLNAG